MWIYAIKLRVSTETVASSAAPTNLTVASSFRAPILLDSTGQTATSPQVCLLLITTAKQGLIL